MSDTISKIEKYFNSTSKYPLMAVVSIEEYKEILISFATIPKVKVSDYCSGADKEPDTEKLAEDVRRKNGNFLLVGLGDYLASKNDVAKKTILSYKDLLLQNNSHIVILLSAYVYQVVKEIYDADPRVRTRIILTPVTMVDVDTDGTIAHGIKAYLEACEKGESIGMVKSERDMKLTNTVSVENAFDELKHKFPNEFRVLSQDSGSSKDWLKLLEELNTSKKNLQQYLATKKFESLEHTFLYYAKKNDYEAWLHFINLKLNTNNQSYLGLVATKATTQGLLFDIAKTAIIEISVSDKQFHNYYEQRKKMLDRCTDVDMADFIPRLVACGVNRVAYLTDNTKIEKQAIIESLCKGAKHEKLSLNYPDLHFYLQDFLFEHQQFTSYFSLYKKCKVWHKVDDDFLNIVAEHAVNRPYNLLPARSLLMSNLDDGETLLIFLDSLGVEYLGYIKAKCAELQVRFSAKVARADLPTITSINRKFFDDWQGDKKTPIKDLDDLKHHPERGYDYNNSPYPIHLVAELDVVKQALERAKTELATGKCKKVLLVSDHGASRLAVISPGPQMANDYDAQSKGRYCIGECLSIATNTVAGTDGRSSVISDYARFAGSRVASVETHGGATLEEVLVPIIELTLLTNNIEVVLENDVIEVNYKTIPTLVLFITPHCDDVTVTVNGKHHSVQKLENNKFEITMPELKKGTYTLNVFESQNQIASKKFTVKSKGFAERDMF